MKKIKLYTQILVTGVYVLSALPALAFEFPEVNALPKDTSFTVLLTGLVNWAFAVGGGLAVLFLVWGGIQYITGGPKAEETAKKTIMNSIIGLIVMALAFVLAQFAINLVSGTVN